MKLKHLYKNPSLELFTVEFDEGFEIAMLTEKVSAGGYSSFSSPALDFPEDSINLMKYLVKDKETTFFARVSGDCLNGIGIYDKSLLVIDKSIVPKSNDVVICFLGDELLVKVFRPMFDENQRLTDLKLKPQNPDFQSYYVNEDSDFQIWGVVTFGINQYR